MAHHLIHTPLHPDLARVASDINDGVQAREIVGLGVVVMLRGNRFFVDAFGSMTRDPHAARGYVAALDDCLREIGARKKDTHTTR